MTDPKKPTLRPANENPWYILATIHGEQGKDTIDLELAAKNRETWNRYYSEALTDEKKADLQARGVAAGDLVPLSQEEKASLLQTFRKRIGDKAAHLPDISKGCNFSRSHFEKVVNFTGFIFQHWADFREATFTQWADFREATFTEGAHFSKATFTQWANFRAATFTQGAHFSRAIFMQGADFREATFTQEAHFSRAIFMEGGNFSKATFTKGADFSAVTFKEGVYFRAATFTQGADFSDATFTKWAHFFEATFTEGAHFRAVTFTERGNFHEATFTKGAHFSRAIFMQGADFGDAVFKGMTLFAHAQFLTHVPDLRGASLHEATEWHGALWPPVSPQDWFGDDCQQQVYAYERLKQEMERLKKHDDEVFFFAKEMRARRGLIPKVWHATWRDWLRLKPLGWLVERGFNCAYEGVSGYGRSFMRPALWMGVVWALGTALHALRPIRNGEPLPWPEAMGWSFANLFAFLPLKREMMADPANLTASGKLDLSWIAHAASGGQAVIGTLLLFLIGLGLRNRFRLR